MEGNDITLVGPERYHVVILEPTLVYLDQPVRRRSRLWRRLTPEQIVSQYRINELMGRWIVQQGYTRSMRTSIWGFGEFPVFTTLCEHVDRLFGRYVFRYDYFSDESEARAALVADNSIHTVYDADHDRVERVWGFRGYRVLQGGAP